WAALALVAALGLALVSILRAGSESEVAQAERDVPAEPPKHGPNDYWMRLLWGLSGFGALCPVVGLGKLWPFRGDVLAGVLIIGAGLVWASVMLWAVWWRRPIPASAAGAGGLAVVVNLLGAGGIGMPSVALSLWALLALGQNLREECHIRSRMYLCGRWLA